MTAECCLCALQNSQTIVVGRKQCKSTTNLVFFITISTKNQVFCLYLHKTCFCIL